jgi:hypothetical protein
MIQRASVDDPEELLDDGDVEQTRLDRFDPLDHVFDLSRSVLLDLHRVQPSVSAPKPIQQQETYSNIDGDGATQYCLGVDERFVRNDGSDGVADGQVLVPPLQRANMSSNQLFITCTWLTT